MCDKMQKQLHTGFPVLKHLQCTPSGFLFNGWEIPEGLEMTSREEKYHAWVQDWYAKSVGRDLEVYHD